MVDFKAGKAAAKVWNAFFHASAALGAYMVMRGKPWHPWFLGGTGQLTDGFLNMPFSVMDLEGYYYGLVIFGHPVQQAFAHFFIRPKGPDFSEMSLHHLVHLSVSASYLMANIIPVGIFIGFIHDVSDVLISVSKGFHLAGYKNTSVITFLLMQVIFIAMRLMALPTIILFLIDLRYAEDRAYLQPYMTMSWIFVSCLLVLHCFWQLLFFKMTYMAIFKGEVRDIQNDIVAKHK